jgi:hypothetical protein
MITHQALEIFSSLPYYTAALRNGRLSTSIHIHSNWSTLDLGNETPLMEAAKASNYLHFNVYLTHIKLTNI